MVYLNIPAKPRVPEPLHCIHRVLVPERSVPREGPGCGARCPAAAEGSWLGAAAPCAATAGAQPRPGDGGGREGRGRAEGGKGGTSRLSPPYREEPGWGGPGPQRPLPPVEGVRESGEGGRRMGWEGREGWGRGGKMGEGWEGWGGEGMTGEGWRGRVERERRDGRRREGKKWKGETDRKREGVRKAGEERKEKKVLRDRRKAGGRK